MRRSVALGVAALLLLSGCNAVVDGGPPARERYDVPETTEPWTARPTTVPGERVAPGLTDETVADAATLVEAHVDALAGRSYRTERTIVAQYPNGTRAGTLRDRAVVHNRSRYYAEFDLDPPDDEGIHDAEWARDGVVYRRVRADGSTEYHRNEVSDRPLDPPASYHRRIEGVLRAADDVEVSRVPGEPTRYRVRVESFEPESRYEALDSAATTFYVAPSGLVVRYRLRYARSINGERLRITGHADYEFRPVEVPRPDWIDEARNATRDAQTATPDGPATTSEPTDREGNATAGPTTTSEPTDREGNATAGPATTSEPTDRGETATDDPKRDGADDASRHHPRFDVAGPPIRSRW